MNACLGIAIDGRPVHRQHSSTRMPLGCSAKPLTAFAYLLLCQEGRAALDDPLAKYLPEIHPVARQVTVRQVMSHTSGLRDACDIKLQFGATGGAPLTDDGLLAFYRDMDDLNAEPGTTWIYNNGAWVLLRIAIERIIEQSFEEVMRERVFERVGMCDSSVCPSGAIVSTVDDLLRWLAHPDVPWASMKEPQRVANGASTGYGLGLVVGRHRGVETLSHPGSTSSGTAQILKVPAAGLDIAVLIEGHDRWAVTEANRILDERLGPLETVMPSVASPLATGVFRSPKTDRVVQLFAREATQIAMIDGFDMPVAHDERGSLSPTAPFVFGPRQTLALTGDSREPSAIQLSECGNADELIRVTPGLRPDLRAIAGHYRAPSAAISAHIHESAAGAQLDVSCRFGQARYDLEYLADGIWRARQADTAWGGTLSFDAGSRTMKFFSYNTRGLPFLHER
jgi:D-aminopeptidase